MRPSEFYQRRLDEVSRSFALCIPQLEAPFREQVALAYLLLRVLDTVEDAPFEDLQRQEAQFERFRGFLKKLPPAAEVDGFRADFPARISEGERALLGDTLALLEDAHELPASAREAIFSGVDRMAEGMAAYARRPRPLRLIDLEDVTRYCSIVAGLVGELLTRLFSTTHQRAPSMMHAYQFGIYLQKINILKDQEEDEAAGRFLVPDRAELLASLREDAEGALAYLRSLPRDERGYRVFCGWSLMLGADSLSAMGGNLAGSKGQRHKKSRRLRTAELLAKTAAIAQDDAALDRLFHRLLPDLPRVAEKAPLAKPESPERFRKILRAPLTGLELDRLGIHLGQSAA